MRFHSRLLTVCAIAALVAGCDSRGAEDDGAAAPATETAEAGSGAAAADAPPSAEGGFRQITWDALMPAGEEEVLAELMEENAARAATIEEGGPGDQMVQIGTFNVVETLDGQEIRMPGYIVPFNFSSEDVYSEFLLVPYFGACIHTPPPPPNQIVYVRSDEPVLVEDIWTPVWVEGTLLTARHEDDLGDAAYTLELADLEIYDGAARRSGR